MSRASILIVEDNNIVMLELKERLEEMGYTVVETASSGHEAIKKAEIYQPDLIMMDIRLKGEMDGIEAAASIRKNFDITVVYLTAHTDDDTLQRAKLTEPYGYIIKPFEERELHSTIEMALYKHTIEKKLKESEQWLSATLKSIGDALIATDSNAKIKFINHIAEDITGWNSRDAFGLNIEQVFKVKDSDKKKYLDNPVTTCLRSGSIEGAVNKYLVAKNGTETPIDFSSAPINIDNNAPAGVVLAFRDVTERIKAKELIEKQSLFLRNIIDTDPNYIVVKHTDGRFELINTAVAKALETTTEQIVGQYDENFFNKEEIEGVRRTDKEVIDTMQEIFIPEEKLIDANGKVHLIQTFKKAINSQNGDEKLVLTVGVDITELKQIEKALRDSEGRLKTLLIAIPDIVLRFSRKGILLDYHASEPSILFPVTDNVAGKNIYDLLDSKLTEEIIAHSEIAFKTNEVQIFEFDKTNYNGTVHNEIRIVNNSSDEFIVIIKNITESKKIQLELKDLNDSKDKFFSIIAHDLKSPFTSLLGLSDYLGSEENDLSDEEKKIFSQNIAKSARSIFSLLENLLQWSKINTGRIDYDPEPIALKELIDKMLIIYKSNLEIKNISFAVELSTDQMVFADLNMVESIFRNLISNSIKFSHPSGSVNLIVKEADDFIEISIIDNGVGIRKDIMSKLFKIDANVSTNGTLNERGSGLGLILCKEFIEMNKGKLTLKSIEGKGATFSFTLPKYVPTP